MRQHHSPAHLYLDHTGHASAGVGRLDFREWSRFVWAWSVGAEVASWLYRAGNIAANDNDVRVQSSSSPSINLPPTWLAADEISGFLQSLNRFSEPEQAANDQYGAFCAVELGRAVSIADRRWPREEKPHRMMAMRCGGCDEMTLTYRPPRFFGDVIIVDCPKCGYALSEDEFSVAALLIEAELKGASVASPEESAEEATDGNS